MREFFKGCGLVYEPYDVRYMEKVPHPDTFKWVVGERGSSSYCARAWFELREDADAYMQWLPTRLNYETTMTITKWLGPTHRSYQCLRCRHVFEKTTPGTAKCPQCVS